MEKSNIVVIMTDQHRFDALGCYGRAECRTPAIDSLASDGVTFDNAYTTCAICSPARASLQNGLYPSRHGITSNILDSACRVHELKDSPRLLSRRLARQGYRLGYTGKWHLGFGPRPQATASEIGPFPERYITADGALPSLLGYDADDFPGYGGRTGTGGKRYAQYLAQRGLEYRVQPKSPRGDRRLHTCWGEVVSPEESTMDAFLVERARHYIRGFAKQPEPFCFQIHFWGPHASATPPAAYLERYRDLEIPPWPNWEDPLIDKPRVHNMWRRPDRDWAFFREFIRHYWAYQESIDAQIGRLLRFLKDEGLYDASWIVFLADHGDSQGCHAGLENKSLHMYEETVRIPLVVKPPAGRGGGTRCAAPVGTCDVYATLVDIAGDDPQRLDGDGQSLAPFTEDVGAAWRDAVVTEGEGLSGISCTQRMLRSGNLKYVFNAGDTDELYDLAQDPHELRNLAADPASASRLGDMRERLCDWMRQHDDTDQMQTAFRRVAGLAPLARS